jgi:hypothetical protein
MALELIIEPDILFPDQVSCLRRAIGRLRRRYYFLHRYIPTRKAFQVLICDLCTTRTPGSSNATGK